MNTPLTDKSLPSATGEELGSSEPRDELSTTVFGADTPAGGGVHDIDGAFSSFADRLMRPPAQLAPCSFRRVNEIDGLTKNTTHGLLPFGVKILPQVTDESMQDKVTWR